MAHSRRRRSLAEMIPLTEGLVTTAEGFGLEELTVRRGATKVHSMLGGQQSSSERLKWRVTGSVPRG